MRDMPRFFQGPFMAKIFDESLSNYNVLYVDDEEELLVLAKEIFSENHLAARMYTL